MRKIERKTSAIHNNNSNIISSTTTSNSYESSLKNLESKNKNKKRFDYVVVVVIFVLSCIKLSLQMLRDSITTTTQQNHPQKLYSFRNLLNNAIGTKPCDDDDHNDNQQQ